MFPKPPKGHAKKAYRQKKRELDSYRGEVNRFVLEADGFICQHCGSLASHAHHVYGRGGSKGNWREKPDSRLSLCNNCHYAIHHGGRIRVTREDLINDLEKTKKRRDLSLKQMFDKICQYEK